MSSIVHCKEILEDRNVQKLVAPNLSGIYDYSGDKIRVLSKKVQEEEEESVIAEKKQEEEEEREIEEASKKLSRKRESS